MKKFNKILSLFMIIFLLCAFITPVFAAGEGDVDVNLDFTTDASDNSNLGDLFSNVWGTVQTVASFIALIMVVFAGIRYMFASADQKADIKKQTIILIVGAIFIFAAGSIVNLIANAAQGII